MSYGPMSDDPGSHGVLDAERQRIRQENARRRGQVDGSRYAPWNSAERLMVDERRRLAARLLHAAGAFPGRHSRCLEIGFGSGGWIPDLLYFGVAEPHIHGVEIDVGRATDVHRRLPSARLSIADAGALPHADGAFDLLIASTVFTSILDPEAQESIAREIHRVLAPGGHLLWYDFARSNPRNPNVRGVPRGRLRELFPGWRGELRSLTLAPPLARLVAPRSHTVAQLLSALPFLRTHLLAVLRR